MSLAWRGKNKIWKIFVQWPAWPGLQCDDDTVPGWSSSLQWVWSMINDISRSSSSVISSVASEQVLQHVQTLLSDYLCCSEHSLHSRPQLLSALLLTYPCDSRLASNPDKQNLLAWGKKLNLKLFLFFCLKLPELRVFQSYHCHVWDLLYNQLVS